MSDHPNNRDAPGAQPNLVTATGGLPILDPGVPPTATLDRAPAGSGATKLVELYPLFLIVGMILGVTLLVALRTENFTLPALMSHFMAGFFLVFGFFKLLDLRGFASAFRMYDPFAAVVPGWAPLYPFIELALGAAYILNVAPLTVNGIVFVLMLVGAAGVWRSLQRGQKLRCACLGTVLNLPMTTVTLVEDLTMAAMAAVMLLTAML